MATRTSPQTLQLLEAVGFRHAAVGLRPADGALRLAEGVPLGPAAAALARLRRLAADKGHSGEAEFFPRPSGASSGGGGGRTGASPLMVRRRAAGC